MSRPELQMNQFLCSAGEVGQMEPPFLLSAGKPAWSIVFLKHPTDRLTHHGHRSMHMTGARRSFG